MKILIENSGYPLTNIGDLAMLQVTVSRLKNLWPDALIEIFTSRSDLLQKFCPHTQPLMLPGTFGRFSYLPNRFYQLISNVTTEQYLSEFEWRLHQNLPLLTTPLLKLKQKKILEYDNTPLKNLIKVIEAADLVIASGGGYITDSFKDKVFRTLAILNLATWLNKPTAMLGHGLGPLQNPELRAQARIILPRVNFISLRESRKGVPLLNSLGVSPTGVMTTGDDAIELAYKNHSVEMGNGIGINLRIAPYADVDTELLKIIRLAIQDAARGKIAPLIPVPIAHSKSDAKTIQQLLLGYDDSSDGGQNLDSPIKVIEQVKRCRVVVTGSYHAGVFALAQGIPVVGLAKSQYYIDKFLGLADQFGSSCRVVFMKDRQLRENLMAAIDDAWKSAEEAKPKLLESARQQIKSGHTAYQKVYELVEARQTLSSRN